LRLCSSAEAGIVFKFWAKNEPRVLIKKSVCRSLPGYIDRYNIASDRKITMGGKKDPSRFLIKRDSTINSKLGLGTHLFVN